MKTFKFQMGTINWKMLYNISKKKDFLEILNLGETIKFQRSLCHVKSYCVGRIQTRWKICKFDLLCGVTSKYIFAFLFGQRAKCAFPTMRLCPLKSLDFLLFCIKISYPIQIDWKYKQLWKSKFQNDTLN